MLLFTGMFCIFTPVMFILCSLGFELQILSRIRFVQTQLMLLFVDPHEATDPGSEPAAPSPAGHLGALREGGTFGAAGARHTGGNRSACFMIMGFKGPIFPIQYHYLSWPLVRLLILQTVVFTQ